MGRADEGHVGRRHPERTKTQEICPQGDTKQVQDQGIDIQDHSKFLQPKLICFLMESLKDLKIGVI